MRPQLRLRAIDAEEVDCRSGPGRRGGIPGGLARRHSLQLFIIFLLVKDLASMLVAAD